ncbi:MAG TPA: glycoside hydrolase family 97 protein [Puia sp.]|nr:glycoside hydrolase family 97 protein [Puia sp.]
MVVADAASARTTATTRDIVVKSPDGRLRWAFHLTDSCPSYSVSFNGETIVDWSALRLAFRDGGEFGRGLVVRGASFRKGEDDYTLVVGKTSSVHDEYNEAEIPMEERGGARRGVELMVRVFNDGVGFRYVFLKGGTLTDKTLTDKTLTDKTSTDQTSADQKEFLLTDEHTDFRLAGDPFVTASYLPGYTTSHEGRYTRLPVSGIRSDTLMDMPVFVEFPHKIYMVITEAELVDYAGMYLTRHNGVLTSMLSPLPGQGVVKVKGVFPHKTPWRVLLIGDRPGVLIESNIITSLNEPCAIKDLSWLRPGKTDFHWWNGDVVPDTTFQPGINFETNQYYIDFCARNKLDYHSVIGYGGIAWYRNDGISYMPGPHSDVTEPLPGLDMQQICDYAKSKGVGIRVWVHWKVLYPELDKAFTQFEKWGISGMMVDFMDRDDQEMVNIQTEILQKAAQHHLHIQFHGAYKPTGLARTWPNEFTREGTLNYECDKWGNPITPDDDINIPFTRLLAGATDYHLGGFRAVTPSHYEAHFVHPLVLGTRCHMLAMYVVLESALGMICDYPAAYEGQDGFEFLRDVPTTWDQTKVPLAVPRAYVSIARRKRDDWYVGMINNKDARTVSLPMDFLPVGHYEAVIYRDADDASENPNHLVREVRAVEPSSTVEVKLAPGGGMAMKIKKL